MIHVKRALREVSIERETIEEGPPIGQTKPKKGKFIKAETIEEFAENVKDMVRDPL